MAEQDVVEGQWRSGSVPDSTECLLGGGLSPWVKKVWEAGLKRLGQGALKFLSAVPGCWCSQEMSQERYFAGHGQRPPTH